MSLFGGSVQQYQGSNVGVYANVDAPSGGGGVTSVATGYGVTGGPITTTGTVSANLLASTRYANSNAAFAPGDILLYPNVVTNTLETQGSVTYAAGTYTINTTGTYKITVTAVHNAASTVNVPVYIRKNADAPLYRCSAGFVSTTLPIVLSLVATNTITILLTDTALTTPVVGATNFVTIERLA